MNTEVFRRLAAEMGYDDPAFQERDEDLMRQPWIASIRTWPVSLTNGCRAKLSSA